MHEDGVTRTTRFDEWPDDGVDLLLRLAGWFGDNAWLIAEVPMYDNQPMTASSPRSYGTPVGDPVAEGTRVRDAISEAEQRANELHEAMAFLEKRLDTVLVPSPPATTSATPALRAGSGPPPSHVYGRLTILNDQLAGAGHRLREIIQRIDV